MPSCVLIKVTFDQGIQNNHIALSKKCIQQQNAITRGNMNGGNIAKPE